MKAIIPTGGRGTRMRPLTFSSNKHFIPVANKPLIFYPIETIAKAGIKEVGITYNPGFLDEVKTILGDGSKWDLKFEFILQDNPVGGVANIVQVAESFIGQDSFVLHLGDNIFSSGINDLVQYFNQQRPEGLITMIQHKDNRRLGVPFFDEAGKFIKYVEKPDNPPNNFGIPGLYFFIPVVFKAFKEDPITPSERGELEIGSLYNWLIDHEYKVEAKEYQGKWLDPGKFNDWISANQYILDTTIESKIESDIDEDTQVENRVSIGKNCHIFNSRIRGPVIIGDNVSIVDSYIGPFTSLADNCELEESHVENSVLMKGVKIKHVVQSIDSSLIGTGTEISGGKGQTAPANFFIGEKCQVII